MANYTNITTLQVLSQEDFSALVCNATYTCCNSSDNVWFTNNEAKTEYEWQLYFQANDMCTPSVSGNLVMTFSDLNSLPSGITDPESLSEWNTLLSSNYTSLSRTGYRISLIGGSGVILPDALFLGNESILLAVDSGSVIEAHQSSFENSINLQNLTLPECVFIGAYALGSCTAMATCYLPKCTNLGGTVGDDSVFNAITGSTITLTIPTSLMTCNSGNPDGDIVYLDANNTVTIVTI